MADSIERAAVFSIYTEWTAEDCAANPEIWFLMSEVSFLIIHLHFAAVF